MTFRSILLVAIFAMTTGTTLAQNVEREIKKVFIAHHQEMGAVVHHAGGIEAIAEALRLSDAQSNNLRALIDAKAQEMEMLTKEMEQKRQSLHQALEEPSPNAMQIGTLTVSIQELERRASTIQERLQNAFSNMLTPEQRFAFEGIKSAAKQIQAFHAAGLVDPMMIHHEFMLGSDGHGVFMKQLEAAAVERR